MKRVSLIFLVSVSLTLLGVKGVFAFDITCPAPKPDPTSLTPQAISGKIESCIKARAENQEGALSASEDFYCPSGKFTLPDGKELTSETIAYHVAVSIFFADIDKEIMQYMCQLRETRETDIIVASDDIRTTLEPTASSAGLLAKYEEVCNFPYIQDHINTKEKQWILSSETYPQTICKQKALAKKDAWIKLGYILMSDGAAKGYQNDKDAFISKVKTKYDAVREKFHSLLQLLDKATTNMTNYIKNAVK